MKSSGHTRSKYRVMSRSEPFFFFSPSWHSCLPSPFIYSRTPCWKFAHINFLLTSTAFSLTKQICCDFSQSGKQFTSTLLLPPTNYFLQGGKKKILGKKMVYVYSSHFLFKFFCCCCSSFFFFPPLWVLPSTHICCLTAYHDTYHYHSSPTHCHVFWIPIVSDMVFPFWVFLFCFVCFLPLVCSTLFPT